VLASFVITLRIDRDLALPGLGGEVLHGLFFEALRGHDTRFAEHLHQEVDKPFSLSGALTEHPKREGRIHVESIDFQPGPHPLVHSTTYPALMHKASQESRVTLQFVSPTSFRSGDVQDVLPRPERVFGSLFEAWQAFSPVPFDPALAGAFVLIRIPEYELRTELIHFAHYKVIGFRGRITYTYPREVDAATRQVLNALADFAFFAGVGYKTTMGMGQSLRQPFTTQTTHRRPERR
jgi:CRISPR-associated endoribonuclease Cas6